MKHLLNLISLCSIILASLNLSQAQSAEIWSQHLVRRGNVTYRPASELTNHTAVRTCLVDGFGVHAQPKDMKIFSQNVRCIQQQKHVHVRGLHLTIIQM